MLRLARISSGEGEAHRRGSDTVRWRPVDLALLLCLRVRTFLVGAIWLGFLATIVSLLFDDNVVVSVGADRYCVTNSERLFDCVMC